MSTSEKLSEAPHSSLALMANVIGVFTLKTCDSAVVEIKNRRAKALLALLCVSEGGCVSRDYAAKLLWPDRFESQARASLRQCLLTLRKLPQISGLELIRASRDTLSLNTDVVETDFNAIETALKQSGHGGAHELLQSATGQPWLDQLTLNEAFDAAIGDRIEVIQQLLRRSLQDAPERQNAPAQNAPAQNAPAQNAPAIKAFERYHPPPKTRADRPAEDRPKPKSYLAGLVASCLVAAAGFAVLKQGRLDEADARGIVAIHPPVIVDGEAQGLAMGSPLASDFQVQMSSILPANGFPTLLMGKDRRARREFDIASTVTLSAAGPQISVRLVQVATQVVLWSEAFSRADGDLGALTLQAAAKPAGILRCMAQFRTESYTPRPAAMLP